MVFTVGDFTLYIDPVQHKILCEHIFNIGINLLYRIDIFHSQDSRLASFPRIPFTNDELLSPPKRFARLYRLIDGNAVRDILVPFHFIDSQP